MKKLIFRKIIKDILSFFLLSSFAITLIVWVIQAVNYLDFVSEDGHSFSIYFMFSLLTLPKIFSKIMLFIFFVSLFVIISRYEENNEILILWTSGINKIKFINALLIFSFCVLIFQLILTAIIVPKTQDLARSYIRTSSIEYFPSLIKPKQFIDTVENLTLFIEAKNGDIMENIFLKDNLNDGTSQIVSAKRGYILNDDDNFFVLEDGEIVNIDVNGTNVIKFDRTIYNLSKYSTKTTTYPKIQEKNTKILFDCFYGYRKNKTQYKGKSFSCESASINAIMQEIYKRVYVPLYLLITTLIAGSLVLSSKTNFNYGRYKVILFFMGVLTVILSEMSIRFVGYENIKYAYLFLMPFLISLFSYIILLIKSKSKIVNANN